MNDMLNNAESVEIVDSLIHIAKHAHSRENGQKKKLALKHFDFFLKNYYKPEGKRPVRTLTHVDIKPHMINDYMCGTFSSYLTQKARQKWLPNKPLLMFGSSYGYLSAWKNYYIRKYKDEPCPKPFRKVKWSTYMRDVKKVKSAMCRKDGTIRHKIQHCIFSHTQN